MRGFLILLVAFLTVGCGKDGDDKGKAADLPKRGTSSERLTAVELGKAFADNAISAEAKFKGKTITVEFNSGGVEKVTPDGSRYFIPVATTTSIDPKEAQVLCYIDPAAHEPFGKLTAGGRIVVTGVCMGRKEKASAYQGFVVVLESCVLDWPKP